MVRALSAALTAMGTLAAFSGGADAFLVRTHDRSAAGRCQSTELQMGLFDNNWSAFGSGSGKDRLDEQWEAQQAILRDRRKPKSEREAYFQGVEKRRADSTKKQQDMWAWQTKQYKKGEDPITEWRKRRADGTISGAFSS
jgi:hypothetical protein